MKGARFGRPFLILKKYLMSTKTQRMQQEKTIRYTLHRDWRTSEIVPKTIEKKLEELLKSAYAPYSNYPVSSVVLLDNGHTVVGTNQENAAFPDGLCGERVAVLAAKAAYPKERIKAIYIMTGEQERSPAAPCGSCRQVLHETEIRQEVPYQLFLMNRTADALEFKGVQDLLPFSFTLPKNL